MNLFKGNRRTTVKQSPGRGTVDETKKLFAALRQGNIDQVKSILSNKPELLKRQLPLFFQKPPFSLNHLINFFDIKPHILHIVAPFNASVRIYSFGN